MGRGLWVSNIYLQWQITLDLNCCHAVSNQLRIYGIICVALLVTRGLSRCKIKHQPIAISEAVDDSHMQTDSGT